MAQKQFSGWNEEKVKQLHSYGKIKNFHLQQKNFNKRDKNDKSRNKVSMKRSKEKDWLKWNLAFWCNEYAVELQEEYVFHDERKWRFDWAIPASKIAIEYEGLFSKKSRHTTVKGYSGDVEKYNHATAMGWRIVRLTAMNYLKVFIYLKQIMG